LLPPELLILAQICTKSFVGDPTGGAYSAPPDPLAGLRGPTSKGGEGEGEGEEGRGREGRGGNLNVCPGRHKCSRRHCNHTLHLDKTKTDLNCA